MATIYPRHNKNGRTTWRVVIRRKGRKPICRAFSSEEAARKYVKENEAIYALTGFIPEWDALKEKRKREFLDT